MNNDNIRVLLVDDEERLAEAMAKGINDMGHHVRACNSAAEALEALGGDPYDVLITDMVMPGVDGMQLLGEVSKEYTHIPVIILTGHGTIPNAVEAMQNGAFSYITKPCNLDEVNAIIRKAAEHGRLLAENIDLRRRVNRRLSYANIIGDSESMQKVFRIVDRVKDTRSTILITGESGTGKELIAKAVHYSGALADKPFVTVDCAAITETLLESELFGHARGAFTGAHRDHTGYFEAAHNGTIFLDEIGEFSAGLQTRLLRVIQEGEFSRVGDNHIQRVNVRVIAATNRDLDHAVTTGAFREDLYYRLNVITIRMPPLRERLDDIPLLLQHFLERFNKKLNRRIMRISPDALEIFGNYSWPGNVRELENIMERLVTFCDDDVLKAMIIPDVIKIKAREIEQEKRKSRTLISKSYKDAKLDIVEQFTKEYIENMIKECDGKITRAANRSGMDRGCFYRLMKKYGIDRDDMPE